MRRVFALPLVVIVLLGSILTYDRQASAQTITEGYVGPQFRAYYERNAGTVSLGPSRTGVLTEGDIAVQYFEKGRLEDQRNLTNDPNWQVLRGRLTVELMERAPDFPISGSTTTYGQLSALSLSTRHAPPNASSDGVVFLSDGTVFVPFEPQLRRAPGYIVPDYFWHYLNRGDIFPTGWLQAIGLPLTDIFPTIIYNTEGVPHQVIMQAFERGILTYDATNPAGWQVQMGNVGWDAMVVSGLSEREPGGRWIGVNLTYQWLYAYEGDELVYDAPVATGRDGWETPAGRFAIFEKYKVKDMVGEERGEKWHVPNVPNIMYFREGGFALHGTYWHNLFGTGVRPSHGCVNLPLDAAEILYNWAPIGTPVIVYY